MNTYVIATSDDAFERRVRRALDADGAEIRRLSAEDVDLAPVRVVELIAGEPGNAPDVVALGPGLDVAHAIELAQRFDRERPEISILLVAEPSAKLWESALRAGVRDVLSPEASDTELEETLHRAAQTATRRRANLVGDDDRSNQGHVITVVSPKGGSGKTTTASNLAVGLAAHAPGEVVVVALDLQLGDISSALQLMPENTIADAAQIAGALDATVLKVYLTGHPANLYALCAPDSPVDGERVTADVAARIVGQLAAEFRYVVVDSAAGLTDVTLAALEISTDIVLVCSMDVPSVRSLRKEVAALDQLQMTSQRRHFVLNRADSRVGLTSDDVEATVGMRIDVAIPSSRAVPLSLNQGDPLVSGDPRSPVAKAFNELVARFTPQAARPTGMLGKLRGSR